MHKHGNSSTPSQTSFATTSVYGTESGSYEGFEVAGVGLARAGSRSRPPARRSRRRFLVVVALFLGLWLATALALVAIPRSQAAVRPYSVAGLRAALAQDPGAWSGRVVSVQGILEGPFVFCGEIRPCPPATLGLIDTEDQIMAPDSYLPVTTEAEATPLRLIRHIPLLSSFVPAPQPLEYGRMAVYTLRLTTDPVLCSRNPAVLCYAGVVLAAE